MTRNAIVALDLSYTATGVACLTTDGRITLRTVHTTPVPDPPRSGWSPALRRIRIRNAVRPLLTPGCLLAKEQRIDSLRVAGNAALDLAALHATIEDDACSRDVPIVNVNVGHVKIYGSNTGRADKALQLDNARRELSRYTDVYSDDEADALWVLLLIAHAAGQPIVRVRPRRLEMVNIYRPALPDESLWHRAVLPDAVTTTRTP